MKSPAEEARIAIRWWRGLQPNFANGERNPNADRAALARLRRADLLAAMQDPTTFDLFRKLERRRPAELPGVALCAAVLADVRENPGEHLPRDNPARTLGPPSIEAAEQAAMKPLRFRRLIEAEAPEDRLIALRRALQLAGHKLNPYELAAACLHWSEARRQRWIFEYYNAGFAAPEPEAPSVEDAVA
jgi:CRISPR system Cascade subunit CasB